MRTQVRLFLLVAVPLLATPARGGEVDDALATIKTVKREGDGNEKAAAAWKVVVKQGRAALPAVLAAFDGADATAANWLRSAVDAIAETHKIPADTLEAFVKDVKRDPRARIIAFELLAQADPSARRRLLPGFLDDPSAGIRREAVAHAMKLALLLSDNSNAAYLGRMRQLLPAARDVDQVDAIAKILKEHGVNVDFIAQYGFISKWLVRGPFDNTSLKGFAAAIPPAAAADWREIPPAGPAEWREFATGDPRGMVDLYDAFDKKKGLVDKKKDAVYALARADVAVAAATPAEIRIGSQNAVKIFLNGKEVFAREAYHHGHKMDQHVAAVTLRKGVNEIILKICQDDRIYDWTFAWAFQCRVVDAIGTPVPLKVLTAVNAKPKPPKPEPKKEPKK